MKTFLTIAAIASCLFLVSCTAETESLEPTQNIKINQNVDQSLFLKVVDSTTYEGEPVIKKDRD
jgi:hypothetical protein